MYHISGVCGKISVVSSIYRSLAQYIGRQLTHIGRQIQYIGRQLTHIGHQIQFFGHQER
ncbi:hypothetical protein [Peribacillus tepidiphilus]|uniref:hypothetical protein n=1 Tax=Peribacillus tepidiphilus TaxID=2652445 RepID=UPI0035B53786